MPQLVDIGITIRTTDENPWFERLMASLKARRAGVPADILVEAGKELTKVEKRLRLFRRSTAKYLCLLEDDTEILHDGWLLTMIGHTSDILNCAIMNPLETREALVTVPDGVLENEVDELTNVAGFCLLVDRVSGVVPDVRVQTMDDLWMSLAARAAGWRVGRSKQVLVRHSKQPWASDDAAPWEQADRSRFGEGDGYYKREQHEAKRRVEARLMVETFGDLARLTLPKELLPWADPLHEHFRLAWDRGMPVDFSIEERGLFSLEDEPKFDGKIGGTCADGEVGEFVLSGGTNRR